MSDLQDDVRVRMARSIVARYIIAWHAREAEWEGYADIGERDWEAIMAEVESLAPFPATERLHDAYVLLSERAGKSDG